MKDPVKTVSAEDLEVPETEDAPEETDADAPAETSAEDEDPSPNKPQRKIRPKRKPGYGFLGM